MIRSRFRGTRLAPSPPRSSAQASEPAMSDGETQVRRGPGRALRLGVPWGRVRRDEANEWSGASAPLQARGRSIRPGPLPARRNARRCLSATAHGAHPPLGVDSPRLWRATRGRRPEGRRVHRRHHARSNQRTGSAGPARGSRPRPEHASIRLPQVHPRQVASPGRSLRCVGRPAATGGAVGASGAVAGGAGGAGDGAAGGAAAAGGGAGAGAGCGDGAGGAEVPAEG